MSRRRPGRASASTDRSPGRRRQPRSRRARRLTARATGRERRLAELIGTARPRRPRSDRRAWRRPRDVIERDARPTPADPRGHAASGHAGPRGTLRLDRRGHEERDGTDATRRQGHDHHRRRRRDGPGRGPDVRRRGCPRRRRRVRRGRRPGDRRRRSAPPAARRPSSRSTSRSEADAKAMVDHAVATYGRLDCLVQQRRGHARGRPLGHRHRRRRPGTQVMAVNVRGVFLGCKYAIPAMVAGGGGSDHQHRRASSRSSAARVPQDAYTASKGAVLSLTRSLAVQFGPNGHPDQRHLPGPGRDAAAHGLAGQGRGGQAHPPGPQPDRPLRQARGDRAHGRSTSPPTSRAGRTAPSSSSTAASPSTTSEGRS